MEFEVLESLGVKSFPMGERTGGVEVVKQRKKREDGSVTGPFVSVKIDVGRTLFVHPDTAKNLYEALGEMLPIASAVSEKLRGERVKKVAEHKGPRSPGKTERDRAKGKTKAKRTRPLDE